MPIQYDNPAASFTADEDLAIYRLVRFDADGKVTYADADARESTAIGVALLAASAGTLAPIRFPSAGSMPCIASGAISAGAVVVQADDGKVQSAPVVAGVYRQVGIALETVTTDGDQIAVMPVGFGAVYEVGADLVAEFFDDFMGKDGVLLSESGSEGVWEDVIVGSATIGVAADQNTGAASIALTAASEAQDAVLYFGDELIWDIDSLQEIKFRARVSVLPTSGSTLVMGVAGDHNLDKDAVAQHAWFKLLDTNLLVETDDGSTDDDDNDTTVDVVNTDWAVYRIDLRDKSNVKFYRNGTRLLPSSTFDLSNYSGGLQPYFSLDKASGTSVGTLLIDYVQALITR